jgi:Tryptophan-associated transmembrane protein (Trp_oprn_chp)
MTDPARRSWFPGLLALIGGGAIVAGSLLTWLEVGGGVSVGSTSVTGTPKGTELLPGQVALGAGVAVALLGLLLLAIRRARRLLGFLVIVGGLAAIAAGALVASSPEDRYIDFAVEKGAPAGQADEVRASLANLFVVSGQEADLGIGLYVAIGGGALAVIGGLTAVFGRRKPKPVEEGKEPSEPKPEDLPEEWLAARALEAEARAAPAAEPPPQELVTQAVLPPLPDPPPEPEEAEPWRTPIPEAPESPPEAEPVARAEEIEPPSEAAGEPAPVPEEPALAPEPVMQTVARPEPAEEPAKPDDRAAWSKPLPDDWTAKPAKRRRRRRS